MSRDTYEFSSKRRMLLAAGAAGASAGLFPALARAKGAYPEHAITMVVPFAPGGATDIPARLIQPTLDKLLGQSVVVENREGANGTIGLSQVVRSDPDGYTIALTNVGSMAVNEHIYDNMPFKPLEDLIPVSMVCDIPGIVVASNSFPANNMAELIDYIRKHPGDVNFASPGAG